jgi:hypothetical protein
VVLLIKHRDKELRKMRNFTILLIISVPWGKTWKEKKSRLRKQNMMGRRVGVNMTYIFTGRQAGNLLTNLEHLEIIDKAYHGPGLLRIQKKVL